MPGSATGARACAFPGVVHCGSGQRKLRADKAKQIANGRLEMDPKPRVYRIVRTQLAVTIAVALTMYVLAGLETAYSALTGGLISVIANFYFAIQMFAGARKSPRQLVTAFYVGEAVKILITIVLFVFAIKVMQVLFLPLFITYVITLLVYWFALLPALFGS